MRVRIEHSANVAQGVRITLRCVGRAFAACEYTARIVNQPHGYLRSADVNACDQARYLRIFVVAKWLLPFEYGAVIGAEINLETRF